MPDIFVSYARADLERARPLVEALESEGWAVWWDIESLRVGESFNRAIQDAISKADCVVVLWSAASIDSRYVEAEAHLAWEQHKLASVVIDDGLRLPVPFHTEHTARLVDWSGDPAAPDFCKLLDDLKALMAPGPDDQGVADTRSAGARSLSTSRRSWFSRLSVTEKTGATTAVVAAAGLLWAVYAHFAAPDKPDDPASSVVKIIGTTTTADRGGIAVTAAGDVTVNADPRIDKALQVLEQQLAAKDAQLTAKDQQLAEAQKALRDAITAIPQQTDVPDAQAKIDAALAAAENGDTAKAEALYAEVEAAKSAEGKASLRAAAEAARRQGSLAFLHDTDKALAAYRRAVVLDADNAVAWYQLGHLLSRVGDLGAAEAAYRKVMEIDKANVAQAMTAAAYGSLGVVYWERGDLDQAEAMHKKALMLDEALGCKSCMASAYGNLGLVYEERGDLDQAEAMARKALTLFQQAGAQLQIDRVQRILDQLNNAR